MPTRGNRTIEAVALDLVDELPRPRLLACDIDGTVLDSRGVLRPAIIEAIRGVACSGVHVVLATGRSPWYGVAAIASRLGLAGPHITMQGALISNPETGRIVRLRSLAPELYDEALWFARQCRIDPIVATVDGHHAVRPPRNVDFLSPAAAGSGRLEVASKLEALADRQPTRVFLPTPEVRHPAVLSAAHRRFGDRASVVWSDRSGIEILAPGTNKAHAVTWLASSEGIDRSEIAAVGDGANDVEMLLAAGRSAAVGARVEAVRLAAQLHVPDSDADGVLVALRAFFGELDGAPSARRRVRQPHIGGSRLVAVMRR